MFTPPYVFETMSLRIKRRILNEPYTSIASEYKMTFDLIDPTAIQQPSITKAAIMTKAAKLG